MQFLTQVQPRQRARFAELVVLLLSNFKEAISATAWGPMNLMCTMRAGTGITRAVTFTSGDQFRPADFKLSGTNLSARLTPPTRQEWTMAEVGYRDMSALRWNLVIQGRPSQPAMPFDELVSALLDLPSDVPGKTWLQVFKAMVDAEARQREEAERKELAESSNNYGSW